MAWRGVAEDATGGCVWVRREGARPSKNAFLLNHEAGATLALSLTWEKSSHVILRSRSHSLSSRLQRELPFQKDEAAIL